jgi:hypothetical protein
MNLHHPMAVKERVQFFFGFKMIPAGNMKKFELQ